MRKPGGKWLLLPAALILAAFLLVSFGRPLGLDVPTWDDLFETFDLGAEHAVGAGEPLRVHFIDVDQADAMLIECGGERMLIDAGAGSTGSDVVSYLQKQGVEKLDCVVGTHPHGDHIGGLKFVLNAFPADRLIMPEIPEALLPSAENGADMLREIEALGIPTDRASAGDTFALGEAQVEILSPIEEERCANLNDLSVCVRISYGRTSFLFTGDMEEAAEKRVLKSGADVSATVLKLGHHGGGSASTESFLRAVNPRYGVIQCGAGNDYGHPHEQTLERAKKYNIRLYRTDTMGTIVMTSNGMDVTVQCDRISA